MHVFFHFSTKKASFFVIEFVNRYILITFAIASYDLKACYAFYGKPFKKEIKKRNRYE